MKAARLDRRAGPEGTAATKPLRIVGIGNLRSLNLLRWARQLAERGHRIDVATTQTPDEAELPPGVVVHRIQELDLWTRLPLVRRARLAPALGNLAARLEADVVHAHYLLPYGCWAARAGVRPLVVSPWGTDALVHARERERGRRRATEAVTAADLVVVNSAALAQACLELGAEPARIRHVLWHADLEGFVSDRADRGLRGRLGWPDEALVVLSLRNFRPDTNVDVLVRAFARLASEEPRARLVLAARSGPLRAAIEALVGRLGLEHLVAFLRVPPEGLPALVGAADVVVSLASSDSAPPSLLEAMASSRALVCAEATSIDEWVSQGDGAEIVPQRDAEATATAILALLVDPELRRQYGARNERVVRQRAEPAGAGLEAVYRELLAR